MAEVQINLETFLRAYMDYAKLWPAMGENRYKDFWMETVKYYLDGKDNDDTFGLSLDGAPKSVLDVIEEMKRARGSSRVAEIKNTVRFVAEEVFYPVYDGGSVSYDNVPQLMMKIQINEKSIMKFHDINISKNNVNRNNIDNKTLYYQEYIAQLQFCFLFLKR